MSEVLVVGSLAYDSIATPVGRVQRTLGGSANYFSLASSLFTQVRVVGVVGEDYEGQDRQLLEERNVDLSGLRTVAGKTFHWAGEYREDMNEAITLATELNVFENFEPAIPEHFRNSSYVFLANIDPDLQLRVLEQVNRPKLVGADTMNFWIQSKVDRLKDVLARVDVLLINEGEAKLLSQKANAIAAAKVLIDLGPKAVVVKRGEYGFVLYTEDGYFILPAFPVAEVVDPTGAGDTFAGGFFGYLAKTNSSYTVRHLKEACVYGCLLASMTVEGFGVTALSKVDGQSIQARLKKYMEVISY